MRGCRRRTWSTFLEGESCQCQRSRVVIPRLGEIRTSVLPHVLDRPWPTSARALTLAGPRLPSHPRPRRPGVASSPRFDSTGSPPLIDKTTRAGETTCPCRPPRAPIRVGNLLITMVRLTPPKGVVACPLPLLHPGRAPPSGGLYSSLAGTASPGRGSPSLLSLAVAPSVVNSLPLRPSLTKPTASYPLQQAVPHPLLQDGRRREEGH